MTYKLYRWVGTIGFNMIISVYIYLFSNGHKSKFIYKLHCNDSNDSFLKKYPIII